MHKKIQTLIGREINTKYVTEFAERGPHTSNLEGHNLAIKRHTMLKLCPVIKPCWCFLLIEYQVDSFYQSEVMNCHSWKIGCVWQTPFCKSSHNYCAKKCSWLLNLNNCSIRETLRSGGTRSCIRSRFCLIY